MIDLDYKVLKFLFKFNQPIKISQMANQMNVKHSTLGSWINRLYNLDLLREDIDRLVILNKKILYASAPYGEIVNILLMKTFF